jgi:hypothetical protein
MIPAIVLVVILYIYSQNASKYVPVLKDGVLDLQSWDQDTSFRLTGQWELYLNQFVEYGRLNPELLPRTLMQMPLGLEYEDVYGQPLPEYDSATYRLHVVNARAGQELGIQIGQMTAAYRLYIDDQLIAASGQLTDDSLAHVKAYRFQTAHIPAGKSSFDIILHTANQYSQRGLIQWPLEFGNYDNLIAVDHIGSVVDMLIVGGLLVLSIMLLFFSLLVPWKKELVILGAFGIATLIQVMLTRQVLIHDLFPYISLAILNKAHYISGYMSWFLQTATLAMIFPGVFPRWFLRPALLFALGVTVYVAVLPLLIFKNINLDWPDLVFMLIGFGISILLVKAVLENKPGSSLIFIMVTCAVAIVLFFAGTGDSSLMYNIFTGSGLFFVIIIITECIIVSRNYIKARQMELSALKDQIRPHFLHNALAAIISISRTDPDSSRDLMVSFSTYLRGRFDFTEQEFISIEQELEIVKAYVALEEARFGERIQVQYQIEAKDFLLPPLMLQPLVENALLHGLQGPEDTVLVTVYTCYKKKMVQIGVRDNGPGIDYSATVKPKRKGVALSNINLRLAKIYGSQLSFRTPENGGFEVYLEIPRKEAPAI